MKPRTVPIQLGCCPTSAVERHPVDGSGTPTLGRSGPGHPEPRCAICAPSPAAPDAETIGALIDSYAARHPDEPLMVASGLPDGGLSLARLVSQRAFSGYWEYHIDTALFTVPPRRSSTRVRPSSASARSITRSTVISPVRKATGVPACAIRIAIASANALLPLPTSPPSAIKSPRRTPPR